MFNLDDSPFRIRKRQRTTSKEISDDQMWQEMNELPSPLIFQGRKASSPERTKDATGEKPSNPVTPTFVKQLSGAMAERVSSQ